MNENKNKLFLKKNSIIIMMEGMIYCYFTYTLISSPTINFLIFQPLFIQIESNYFYSSISHCSKAICCDLFEQ